MARVPVIDSPCPLKAVSMPTAGRDHCGHCDRKVHNLDGMSSARREAFLQGCSGKVCVAYTVHRAAPRRNLALGAGLLASLVGSGAAMAQDPGVAATPAPAPAPAAAAAPFRLEDVESTTILTAEQIANVSIPEGVVFVGGILEPGAARWADESELPPSDAETLQEIDALEWLPSKPD